MLKNRVSSFFVLCFSIAISFVFMLLSHCLMSRQFPFYPVPYIFQAFEYNAKCFHHYPMLLCDFAPHSVSRSILHLFNALFKGIFRSGTWSLVFICSPFVSGP